MKDKTNFEFPDPENRRIQKRVKNVSWRIL